MHNISTQEHIQLMLDNSQKRTIELETDLENMDHIISEKQYVEDLLIKAQVTFTKLFFLYFMKFSG